MKAAEAGDELGLSFTDTSGRLKGVVPILQEIKRQFPDLSNAAAQVKLKKAFGSDEAVKFLLQMSAGMESLEGNIQSVGRAMKTGTAVTEQMADAMNQGHRSPVPALAPADGQPQRNPGPHSTAGGHAGDQRRLPLHSVPATHGQIDAGRDPGGPGTVHGPRHHSGRGRSRHRRRGHGGTHASRHQGRLRGHQRRARRSGFGGRDLFFARHRDHRGRDLVSVSAQTRLGNQLRRHSGDHNRGLEQGLAGVPGIRELVGSLSGGVGQMSAELAQKLESAGLLGFVVTVFKAYYRVREALAGLWGAFSHAFGRIRAILEPTVRTLMSAYAALASAVFSVVEIFGVAASATDGSSWRTFGTVIGTVAGVLLQGLAFALKIVAWNLSLIVRALAVVVRSVVWVGKIIVGSLVGAAKFIYKFLLPVHMIGEAFMAAGKIVYSVWQVLTGDISLLDGLKAIGGAVYDFLATPFRWARDVVVGVWNFISGIFTSIGRLVADAAGQIGQAILNLPIISTLRDLFATVRSLLRRGTPPSSRRARSCSSPFGRRDLVGGDLSLHHAQKRPGQAAQSTAVLPMPARDHSPA